MPTHERPNLLLIHSDQHTPMVTGCYGNTLVETPNLDRLAASGVVFDAAYCASPICVPSRMSMLSERHPYQNRVWTNQDTLNSGIATFAHALGAAGYDPVLAGRMHSVGPDQLHGYADRLIGDHGSNYLGGSPVDRGVLTGTAGPDRVSLARSGPGQSAYQVHDEVVTAEMVAYIERLGVQKRAGLLDAPFCLTGGFMLPHPPYVARREDYERYRDRMTLPEIPRAPLHELHPHLRWWVESTGIEEVSEEEILRARAAYFGLVTRMDAMIGQILDTLHTHGLDEDTLIIYTSDHGDMLGEHGLWWKHAFYEASARVPLIVSWPGVIPAGQRSSSVVSALDVTATLLDALEAPALPNGEGRSFLDQMKDPAGEHAWLDEAFSEYCTDRYCPEVGCYQRMIRRGDWKLIYYHGQPPQLFNLAEDPDEVVDRAADPACREVREDLLARVLDGWDPEWIAAEMAAHRADNALLAAWARQVQPPDQYRWPLRPEMNILE